MQVYTKKSLSFLLVLVILLSSISMSFAVLATEFSVNLELNGGTIDGTVLDFTQGDVLPNYENVTKAGATFGGWYTTADFTGTQVFSVPTDATESITYYARWIEHSVGFESFDSYTSSADLLAANHWADWKWPATNTETTLNTNSDHVYSGNNSMKISPNAANTNANILNQNKSFSIDGSGMAFWVEATGAASIKIVFNQTTRESKIRSIPAGKFLITIPWSEIRGASDMSEFWSTQIVASVADASASVYIDSIGTFIDQSAVSVTFNTNGGSWANGFTPLEKYSTGMPLPNYENIKKAGATFGGWYTTADFTGAQVISVLADTTESITYYARWIEHTVGFENFDSYTSSADLLAANHWADWKWPAANTETTLNTNSDHVYSGNNSMKISPNAANTNANILNQNKSFSIDGSGMAFWVEATGAASIKIVFNQTTRESKIRSIPAGKFLITIPWSEIRGASDMSEFWSTQIVATVADASDSVYVDSIGIFTDKAELSVTFNTNGGSWANGFTPLEKYSIGDALPTMDNIEKEGLVFAGWYDNVGFTNKPIYTVPGTLLSNVTYYARWIKIDANFSDFEGFTDDSVITSIIVDEQNNTSNDKSNGFITEENGAGGFYYWGGVAGSTVQLNTNSKYANSGSKSAKLVLKVKDANTLYNTTQFGSDRVYFPSDKDLGEGICFWVNTDKEITLDVQLNYTTKSSKITVPAGKHFVTIPWSELDNKKAPWMTLIRIDNPDEEAVVYIDDIGTYTVPFDNKVTFNTNGGTWANGYNTPIGYYSLLGLTLPDCNQLSKDGLTFAGWYENEALSGTPVYSIASNSSGDKEYWAKWIIHDVNFDNFDSYDTNEDLLTINHWSDWKWPAMNTQTTLNTDTTHTYNGGKSMKVCPNQANTNDELVVARMNYPQEGDGIAFWIESTSGATVKIKFNGSTNRESQARTVSAGRRIVTIPWSEISGAMSGIDFWQTSIIVSVPNADDVVYIDEIGTYVEDISTANNITYYTLGGSWVSGYTAPTKYTSAGVKLPTYEYITKQGYIFAGWYENENYSGTPVTETAASGNKNLYAKWVKHTVDFDDFEAKTDAADYGAWSESATPSLNTVAANAYNGTKSLKLGVATKETYNQSYATVCKVQNFAKAGDGIAFWIKSEIATELLVAFDSDSKTHSVNVPAGKSMVIIPWADFTNLPDGDTFWCMFFRIPTKSGAANTVYIDDIGTYTDSTDRILTYNLNGGSFVEDSKIALELDAANITVLPTDEQIEKEGFSFAGWYDNADFNGQPIWCLKPDNTKNREFWAKWVEQVNINHDFEKFSNSQDLANAEWGEAEAFGGWRESGSVKIYLETNTENLAPNSNKGLRAEYEVLGGEYIHQGGNPSAEFHNFSWSTTFGNRGTDREGDGFRFWIKSDRTITMRIIFRQGGESTKTTTGENIIIPASEDGVTVYLPWSYIKPDDAKTLASMGFIIYDSLGTKGTVWLDDLGIYYNEKLVDFVAENDDKDIKISGYNNHIPKDTDVQITKYDVSKLESLGGQLPKGTTAAYLAEYKLLNTEGGITTLYGPAWVSFKLPTGADISKIGVYEVFFDGSLDMKNYTIEGEWITIYTVNPDGTVLVTLNDTNWSAKGITIDKDVVQSLTATTTITTNTNTNTDSGNDVVENDNSQSESTNTKGNAETEKKPKRKGLKQNNSAVDTSDSGANWWIIVIICVGAAVVLSVIVFIVVKCRRRKDNGGVK